MAIRHVAKLGDPVLRQRAQEIPHEKIRSEEIQRLIDDMQDTIEVYEGIGLAAPQVHESVRLFITRDVYDPAEENRLLLPAQVVINPTIKFLTQNESTYWEGCLSIPDLRGMVPRPNKIQVTGYDRDGRKIKFDAEGFAATVVQHENDHLDGIVFLDRMADLKSLAFLKEFERHVAAAPEEIAD